MLEIVEKYGGTSMAQPQVVIERLEESDPWVVVVSAPGKDASYPGCEGDYGIKMTDLLVANRVDEAFVRAEEMIQRANLGEEESWKLLGSMDRWLKDNEGNVSARQALGERFSAELIAAATGRILLNPLDLIAINGGRNPQQEASLQNIKSVIEPSKKYVLAGYYGYEHGNPGKVQVLERGGSDTTGALVSAALKVPYHNLTDVDGYFTTNPSANSDALSISQLRYGESRGLALAGSQLLHPMVARVMSHANLSTTVRNTFRQDSKGTVVSNDIEGSRGEFVATASRNVYVVDVKSVGIDEPSGVMRPLYDALADAHISYLTTNDGPDETAVVLPEPVSGEYSLASLQSLASEALGVTTITVSERSLVVAVLSKQSSYARSNVRVVAAAADADEHVIPLGGALSGQTVSMLTRIDSRESVERSVHTLIRDEMLSDGRIG